MGCRASTAAKSASPEAARDQEHGPLLSGGASDVASLQSSEPQEPAGRTGSDLAVNTQRANAHDDPEDAPSVIQFACAIFYCEEREGKMDLEVSRLGDASKEASFDYTTLDSTAKAGKKYHAISGTETFRPGETTKSLRVPLIEDDSWDATLEFKAAITEVRGAQPGRYLHSCRVKVIDNDSFPSNKFIEQLEGGRSDEIPGIQLMIEFCKLNLRAPVVRRHTVHFLLGELLTGLYLFLTLYLQIYLVDVVLAKSEKGSEGGKEGEEGSPEHEGRLLSGIHAAARAVRRLLESEGEGEGEEGEEGEEGLVFGELIIPGHRRATALIIALLYVLPFGIVHLVKIARCYLSLPGDPRKMIQANLLQKFLNYKEEHRQEVNQGEITMVMMRDAIEVVDFGYMKILSCIGACIRLLLMLIFIFAENHMALIPLIMYIIILPPYLVYRERVTVEMNHKQAEKQDKVMQELHDAIHNYSMVANFQLQPMTVDGYERCIDDFHEQQNDVLAVLVTNANLAPALTTILIGIYMLIGSFEVKTVGGSLSLGAFIATINVFKEMGNEISEIYTMCLEVQKSVGPLEKICNYMNMPTDTTDRMRINRARRETGLAKTDTERRKNIDQGRGSPKQDSDQRTAFAADKVKLEIQGITYRYPNQETPILDNVSASFHAGALVAFVGPPHEGKGTLLKLMGQALLPAQGCGTIFVPPHLRILHVTQNNCLMKDSFLANIILGNTLPSVGGRERVHRICERLGFGKEMLHHLDDSTPSSSWQSRLSHTDYSRLNLARAFVMNPECLCIHKPALVFDHKEADNVIGLIREHVDCRGLELPESDRRLRRPRTVFFTAASQTGIRSADEVYMVSAKDGLTKTASTEVPVSALQ